MSRYGKRGDSVGIKTELAEIVGIGQVLDSPEEFELYSRDYSFAPPRSPSYVVRPGNTREVQQIVELARQHRLPLVPVSSAVHFNGAGIPQQGGIVIDLRRMNRVLEIDGLNRKARIEAGVTWLQLQQELAKHNLMALIPLLPHQGKSALTSYLEREPALIPQFDYAEPLLTMEIVFGSGKVLRTGSACVPGALESSLAEGVQPEGPGLDFFRLVQGAQGTMGIVTWANIKVEYLPQVNKLFFLPCDGPEMAAEVVYRLGRKMIGKECFLLNCLNLAAILAEGGPGEIARLSRELPPWTLVLVLSGGPRRSGEKLAYEEEALREVTGGVSLPKAESRLPAVPGAEEKLLGMIRGAWPGEVYWKFRYRSRCQDLFFITTLERAYSFVETVEEVAGAHGDGAADIGFYIQPLENGRACHFEASFYYRDKAEEATRTRSLYDDAARAVLRQGALFTRPYGPLADLIYPAATDYTTTLRKVKQILDPDNILSPGRLCF